MIKETIEKLKANPVLIIAIIIIVVVAGYFLYTKGILFKKMECVPLTPLALQNFEMASGEKPKEGEKCKISEDDYFIKLTYSSSDTAQGAKMLLTAGTEGEKKEIDDYDWIINEGDSSVFIQSSDKLGILVMPGETSKSKVEKAVKKVEKSLK